MYSSNNQLGILKAMCTGNTVWDKGKVYRKKKNGIWVELEKKEKKNVN